MDMWRVTLLGLLLVASAVWADPVDDLKTCQAQVGALTMQAHDAQPARTAWRQ